MSEVMIVSVLGFVGTSIGSIAGILIANKLTNYRIEQLEIKVDKHNSIIERTYCLEKEVAIIKSEMKGGK